MIEAIVKRKKFLLSVEVFPPKREMSVESVTGILDGLEALSPDFVSVTYGAAASRADNSTLLLARSIRSRGLTALPHLTALYQTREDVEKLLKDMQSCGLDDLFVLRGDRRPGVAPAGDFCYANELAAFVRERSDCYLVGACYPEGHFECESRERDLENLKRKVDDGVRHLITQLFFDNEDFYRFTDRVGRMMPDIPVQAGLMPVVRYGQVERIISLSGAKLPAKFSRLLARFGDNPEAFAEAGFAYAVDQIADLITAGARGVHLYIMNNLPLAIRLFEAIGPLVKAAAGENA